MCCCVYDFGAVCACACMCLAVTVVAASLIHFFTLTESHSKYTWSNVAEQFPLNFDWNKIVSKM